MSLPQPTRRYRRRPISEINVVPYIDVMLVLLVIFMATAPLLTEGIEVELPEVGAQPLTRDQRQERIVISVRAGGEFYYRQGARERRLSLEDITSRVRSSTARDPEVEIFIRGDANSNYAEVARVLAAVQNSGGRRVGLVTRPSRNF